MSTPYNQTNRSKTKLNPSTAGLNQIVAAVATPSAVRPPARSERPAEVRVTIRKFGPGSRPPSSHQINGGDATEQDQVRHDPIVDRADSKKQAGHSPVTIVYGFSSATDEAPTPAHYILSGALTPRRPSPIRSTFLVAAHSASLRRLRSSSSTRT